MRRILASAQARGRRRGCDFTQKGRGTRTCDRETLREEAGLPVPFGMWRLRYALSCACARVRVHACTHVCMQAHSENDRMGHPDDGMEVTPMTVTAIVYHALPGHHAPFSALHS